MRCQCGHSIDRHAPTTTSSFLWHCTPGCYCTGLHAGDYIAPPVTPRTNRRRVKVG